MYNPFGMDSARQGFGQQGSNQPYDFKGLESRLGKIETGIAGLTEQFGKFQMPGQGTVQPEYTGNTAPDPLTTAAPAGGIQSLPTPQDTGFNFDPQGGSLFDQLSTSYGQPATQGQAAIQGGFQPGRGGGAYTQGFSQFVQDQGYYVDKRPEAYDAGWGVSETAIPIGLGGRMEGQQVWEGYNDQFNPDGTLSVNKPTSQPGRPNPLLQGPINDIHDTGLLPGAPSGSQLGLPQQIVGLGGGRERPGWTGQPQQQRALQAGVGSLQGPTQQKIKQGYQV